MNKEENKRFVKICIAIILCIAIVGVGVYIGFTMKTNENNEDKEKDTASKIDNSLKESGMTLETLNNEYKKFIEHSGIILNCWTSSEDYNIIIANSNGEYIEQNNTGTSTSIYMNDGTFLINDGTDEENVVISYNKGYSVLKLLDLGIEAAKQGKGHFQAIDISDKLDEETYRFAIDFNGYNEIQQLYGLEDAEFGKNQASAIKESLKQFSDKYDTSKLSVRLQYICNETSGFVEGTYIWYFDDKLKELSSEVDDDLLIIWDFNDYRFITDWEMPDKWYKFDYSTIGTNDSAVKITEMSNDLVKSVSEIVMEYIKENYDIASDDKSGSGSVNKEQEENVDIEDKGDIDIEE